MGNFDFIETDKRILEQKVRRHQLSQQDLTKLLKNLPDDKEMAMEIAVVEEPKPHSAA